MVGQHESWVERRIREAQERGAFDDLPGAGKPLDFRDQPHDEDWWVKGLIEREQLDMTAALPPQLALRKEAQGLRERALQKRTEQAVRDLAEDFNDRVREHWRRPMEGPLVVVRPVDVEKLAAQWQAHRPAEPVAATPHLDSRRPRRGLRA
ncbi:MAG: DnaJ family domain-containing protein, partial [Thermocrispum sp.]